MISLFAAIVSWVLGAALCLHYPIAPLPLLAIFAAWSLVAYLRPTLWLAVVPALVPLIGFASWTGWLTFEEIDILILGAAAGGYARVARRALGAGKAASPGVGDRDAAGISVGPMILVAIFAASVSVSVLRGLSDAGGLQWEWTQGYFGAMNTVRVAKCFPLALLMTPLLIDAMRRSHGRAADLLSVGLAIGSAGAALAVVWERVAFAGLLNFSSDYRATGLFWETHVGGAALDGFLMLTLPFAVRELLRASTPLRFALCAAAAGAIGYACLTTFSRGVYLAAPITLGVMAVLLLRQRKGPSSTGMIGFSKSAALAALGMVAFHLAFRSGGYRALMAVLGAFALSIPLATIARSATLPQWVVAIVGGAVTAAVGAAAAVAIPKGPYLVYAAGFACCSVLLWHAARHPESPGISTLLSAHVWLLAATAGVALHWGGEPAFTDSLVVVTLLAGLLMASARMRQPIWPGTLRGQGAVLGSAALLAGIVAIFSGGAYMTDRLATSRSDLTGRIEHWTDGVNLLRGRYDWALGKGFGRFPANYFFGTRDPDYPGTYRLVSDDGRPHLALSGPTYSISWGDAFRVGQRVPALTGDYTLTLEARVEQEVRLHVEICERHLLYNEACALAAPVIGPAAEGWQQLSVPLDGRSISGGPWYAPRLAFFALAVESSGMLIELRDVALIGPDGRNLIANGDFHDGMARWFSTSDRFHLPWHIKNLALDVLFDQGLLGLALFSMLVVVALWRVSIGDARDHPLGPALAAAIVGFLAVGLFDSLLDVPRLAFLFYLLLLTSLALRTPRRAGGAALPPQH